MRTLRALGLVTVGVLVGVGAMLSSNRVLAQSGSRFESTDLISGGGQWFQFFRDTRTNTCYLASMSHTSSTNHQREVTALTQTDQMSCVQ